jgi:hypothetical protein
MDLRQVAIWICQDIEDECWGIRVELEDGVLDGEQALREILSLLRSQMTAVLDFLREAERGAESDGQRGEP